MIRNVAISSVILSLLLAIPQPAAAATFTASFDFISAVQINSDNFTPTVVITGVRTGTTGQVTMAFTFLDDPDMAARCERFATFVMENVNRRLIIGSHSSSGSLGGGCVLIRL
jgi:hypothetical protein